MTDLTQVPLYAPADLGKPIPRMAHATSVCLPLWKDNIDYEKGTSRVISKLECGYPRFVYSPFVQRLAAECTKKFAKAAEECIAFPSKVIAQQCQAFLHKKAGVRTAVFEYGVNDIYCMAFPTSASTYVRDFWQHTGLGLSSRQALAALENRISFSRGESSHGTLQSRIAHATGCSENSVFLFPTGMAAIFCVLTALQKLSPGCKSVQFGFSYVDTLKIQEKFGPGVHFFGKGDDNDLDQLESLLRTEKVSGIFCELPMNPLLRSPNLVRLAKIARDFKTPLTVDDTLASFANIRILPFADIVASSLTKIFSGVGDVMGGALAFDPDSEMSHSVLSALREDYQNNLGDEDADALVRNSFDFQDRVRRINETTEMICDYLHNHSRVKRLYYPKYVTSEIYNCFKKKDAGFGGVFSLLLKDFQITTPKFFDALKISKGPSLGTNFSLACPYTILAHYDELEKVEKLGVSRYLIRISIGLEEQDELINRIEEAFRKS